MLSRSVTAISIFSIFLVLSQAFSATSPGVDSNDSTRLNVQWRSQDGLNCGYDPYGAQEGLYNHQINLRRLRRKSAGKNISAINAESRPRVEQVGDVVVIEDDGTIVMPPNKFDLKNSSVIFTPQSNGYLIARGALAFNKNFGERIRDFIGNGDQINRNNGFQEIELQGTTFPFFGSTYDRAFIGTNGYITFNSGDTLARPSGASLAAAMPRIAPLWADLDFSRKGSIHYLRLSDAHQITWNAAPQTIYSGASTFQALLYDDGRIAFVYKKVKARSIVTGISPGNSESLVQMVDLSNPDSDAVEGAFFESFSKDKRLDEPALTRAFYSAHQDLFDTLYIWTDFEFDNGLGVAHAFNVRNDISGIGIPFFDRGAIYGSEARLSAILKMGNIADNWPADPQSHAVGLNSAISIVCHEQGHRWLSYIQFEEDRKTRDDLLGRDFSHWSFLMDTRTNDSGSFSSLMEGNAWREAGGGVFVTTESAVNHFSELDQYLMGLRSPDDVGNLTYLEIEPTILDLVRERSPLSGFSMSAVSRRISLDKIIRHEGPRVPDVTTSPKTFRIAFILLVEQGKTPSTAIMEKVDRYREAQVRYFSVSTGRRGSLDSSLVDTLR